jgi:dTDP-4-dehydrorhamnose 3,5-epimerase
MRIHSTRLDGALLLEPVVLHDKRGFFFESFNQKKFFDATGTQVDFVQSNHSQSVRGVLRGLHYQLPPREQGKLVRVLVGEIFDLVLDLRKKSPTFGQWLGHRLSAENRCQIWIPPGFAHGFLTLSQTAELSYDTTEFWSAEHARTILWNDPDIGISWPAQDSAPILSEQDAHGSLLAQAQIFDY